MPNWCITSVAFKGKPENIKRLYDDIQKVTEWAGDNPFYCNMRYLLYLNNFDTVSYIQRYPDRWIAPNFRGSAYDYRRFPYEDLPKCEDGDVVYYTTLEMAWNTDYELLQIISMIYDVEFSAFSEEPNMDIYTRCGNGLIDDFDYTHIIRPDYDQFEEFQEESNYSLDIDYINAVKNGSSEMTSIIEELKKNGIEFTTETVQHVLTPKIYGIYYHYIYGVDYDGDPMWSNEYPGTERFNKYYTPGIIYDTEK